ncbi:hypothetical protein [Actinomadura formosensis]|uniref:hypothetical protein n=1 Tax=Actinomadura formosensis TaxID=60706 RepID=UPI003D8DA465
MAKSASHSGQSIANPLASMMGGRPLDGAVVLELDRRDVFQEPAEAPVAELAVVAGVEDEPVDGDVDQRAVSCGSVG